VSTGETVKNRGTVRYGDFYEGRVTVIKGSGFIRERQTSFSQQVIHKAVQ
jgi:hypothetical protein